jgi:hypothetical protein
MLAFQMEPSFGADHSLYESHDMAKLVKLTELTDVVTGVKWIFDPKKISVVHSHYRRKLDGHLDFGVMSTYVWGLIPDSKSAPLPIQIEVTVEAFLDSLSIKDKFVKLTMLKFRQLPPGIPAPHPPVGMPEPHEHIPVWFNAAAVSLLRASAGPREGDAPEEKTHVFLGSGERYVLEDLETVKAAVDAVRERQEG